MGSRIPFLRLEHRRDDDSLPARSSRRALDLDAELVGVEQRVQNEEGNLATELVDQDRRFPLVAIPPELLTRRSRQNQAVDIVLPGTRTHRPVALAQASRSLQSKGLAHPTILRSVERFAEIATIFCVLGELHGMFAGDLEVGFLGDDLLREHLEVLALSLMRDFAKLPGTSDARVVLLAVVGRLLVVADGDLEMHGVAVEHGFDARHAYGSLEDDES